jgi:GNAT superfamily N-acetyltransferase
MNEQLSFRKGSLPDLAQLKNLGLLAYGQFADVLSKDNWVKFEAGLNNETELRLLIAKSTVFVCETIDKEIVGMAFFIPNENPTELFLKEWCCIRRLAVHPGFRGLGIAKKLTEQCINFAKETGEKVLALHTSEFMEAARSIYEKRGFVKVKEIDGLFGKRYWVYNYILES